MDTSTLATQLGIGIATGVTTMLVIAVLCIPASWAGNRLIYHAPFMRFVLMILAVCLSPFIFIGLVLKGWYTYLFSTEELTYTWYFGLFPLTTKLLTSEKVGWAYGGSVVSWFGNLFLSAFYGDIDTKTGEIHYKELIHRIYPEPPKDIKTTIGPIVVNADKTIPAMKITTGYVCEELLEAARYAAAIPAPTPEENKPPPKPPKEWTDLMNNLSKGAKLMYGIA